MATHCSVLAWRIPRTEEPGGLQTIGSQRGSHDWSNSAHLLSWQPLITKQDQIQALREGSLILCNHLPYLYFHFCFHWLWPFKNRVGSHQSCLSLPSKCQPNKANLLLISIKLARLKFRCLHWPLRSSKPILYESWEPPACYGCYVCIDSNKYVPSPSNVLFANCFLLYSKWFPKEWNWFKFFFFLGR